MSDKDNKVTSLNGEPVQDVPKVEVDINFFVFDDDSKPQYAFSVRTVNFQITDTIVIAVDKYTSETRVFPIEKYAAISVKEIVEEEEKGPEIITDA